MKIHNFVKSHDTSPSHLDDLNEEELELKNFYSESDAEKYIEKGEMVVKKQAMITRIIFTI